jgi:hypothetical protein
MQQVVDDVETILGASGATVVALVGARDGDLVSPVPDTPPAPSG